MGERGVPARRLLLKRIFECWQKQDIDPMVDLKEQGFFIPENYQDITWFEFELVARMWREGRLESLAKRLFPELRATDLTTDDESINPRPMANISTDKLEQIEAIVNGND
jgi:hypothetical protein